MVKNFNGIQNTKLVKKPTATQKIVEIENKTLDHYKYVATPEFNKLTKGSFAETLKQANLASKERYSCVY